MSGEDGNAFRLAAHDGKQKYRNIEVQILCDSGNFCIILKLFSGLWTHGDGEGNRVRIHENK